MRTTVDIPDSIYQRLKTRAAQERRSVRELILRGVAGTLRPKKRTVRRRVRLPIVPSKRPGSLDLDNDKIFEIIPFP